MLNVKQFNIASIGSYAALSDAENLRQAISEALDNGLSINELKEVFMVGFAYCGVARGLQAITIGMEVLEERKNGGVVDEQGREPSPITDIRSKYDRGEEVQILVSGWSKEALRSGMLVFHPKIDSFLKEFVFADLYGSDVLSYADREIVNVSGLMAMEGIDPIVYAHLNNTFNLGMTEEDTGQLIAQFEKNFGSQRAEKYRGMLQQIVAARKNK